MTTSSEILNALEAMADPNVKNKKSSFGINPGNNLGITMPNLRKIAKQIGKNHNLALELWTYPIHEARILASLIADNKQANETLMEQWVRDFDSWAVCDQCCVNLFCKTPYAYEKAVEWTEREEEYVKRAGFTLMAVLAVHDKKASDNRFIKFFPYIERECMDNRNFVKKAVNWALRQIGKRNRNLNTVTISFAEKLREINDKTAKWIATDALRELKSESVQKRIVHKKQT